jgi:hypothetical protein
MAALPKTPRALHSNKRYKWLMMVYMQASDNSNLDSLAVQDLKEIQQAVLGSPGESGNSSVIVFVQMNRRWPTDVPQRYVIENDKPVTTLARDVRQNMATSKTLEDFLLSGLNIAEAENICLVLWGHNFGLGFGRDHNDPLRLDELRDALETFDRKRKERRTKKREHKGLDLLATNSCTMAYIEAAYEIKNCVRYMVASQVFMPLSGFPYQAIIRSIDENTDAQRLGTTFVHEYVDSFVGSAKGEKVAMSLLDLKQAGVFKSVLQKTASQIHAVIRQGGDRIVQKTLQEIQDVFLANPAGDVRPVLDLQKLALDLMDYCDDTLAPREYGSVASAGVTARQPSEGFLDCVQELRDAGDALFKAVSIGIVDDSKRASSETMGADKSEPSSIVMEHRQNPALGPLGGIGVFAPFVVDKLARAQLQIDSGPDRQKYQTLTIFENGATDWPKLVYDELRRNEPDEIIDSSGLVRPVEVVAVNQMAAAVDAAFNIFDRVLQSNRATLLSRLGKRLNGATKRTRDEGLASFGPPHLLLAGEPTLFPPLPGKPDVNAFARTLAVALGLDSTNDRPNVDAPRAIVSAFSRIERALGLVETTVTSVATNGTFGLGPPGTTPSNGPKPAGGYGPKPAGGYGPKPAGGYGPKPAGGYGPKPAGGYGPKPAGGYGAEALSAEVGAITAFLSSDAQVAALSVTEMFRALAAVLSDLEDAVSAIEVAASECLQPGYGSLLPNDHDYEAAMYQRFARLFAIASEASFSARQTARDVMSHPVYGLGSGPEDFGQPERDELALAAGLNHSQLALLLPSSPNEDSKRLSP